LRGGGKITRADVVYEKERLGRGPEKENVTNFKRRNRSCEKGE